MALQTIKLRLPGTTNPVIIYAQHLITARQVKTKTKEQYHIKDIAERKVVLVPTTANPGRIIEDDQVVDIDQDDVLELWKQPYLVNLVLAGGQSSQGGREIAVDYAAPLYQLVPSLQRACNLEEEFVFKQLEPTKKESQGIVKILNANQSLEEQNFGADSWLIICPLKIFHKPLNSLTDVIKEGMLFKRSNKKKEKLNEGGSGNTANSGTTNLNAVGSGADAFKYTSEQRRWGVLLKDAVLVYYKNKEDPKPAGVIPLEYFTVRFLATPITNPNMNNNNTSGGGGGIGTGYRFSLQLKRHFAGVEKTKTVYIISIANEKDSNFSSTDLLRDWYEAIKKFSKLDEKETKMFGIDLKELVLRSKIQTGSDIPPIIRDIVSFLDNNGLDEEGLFRQSGNASLIETYRQYYDAGVQVVLKDIDVHSVAGLLKRFFRELPEPLLTFELYDEFIRSHASDLERKEKLSRLLEAIKKLPEEHQVILKYITSFFGRIAQNSSVNKMSKTNLGIVFGPNLIRPKDQHSVDNYSVINDILLTLIEEHSHIFISSNNPTNNSSTGGNFSSLRKPVPAYNPTSSPNAHSSSNPEINADGQFLKEGVLSVKDISNGKSSNWRDCIVRCQKTKLLVYGSKGKDTTLSPKLSFDLKLSLVGNSSEKQFCFVLQQATNIVFLAAANNNDFEDWMKTVSSAISECNSKPEANPSFLASSNPSPSSPSSPTPTPNNNNNNNNANTGSTANTPSNPTPQSANSPNPVNNPSNNGPPPIGPKPRKLPPGAVAVPGFSTAVVQQFKDNQAAQSPQPVRQAQTSKIGVKPAQAPANPQNTNQNNPQQSSAPAKVAVVQSSRRPTSPNPVRPLSPGPTRPISPGPARPTSPGPASQKPVTNPSDRNAISPNPRRKLPEAPSSNQLNNPQSAKEEEKLKELNTLLAEERAARVNLEKLVKTLESKLREEAQTRQKLEAQLKDLSSKLSSLMTNKKPVKRVKANYSYEAEEDNELSFEENDELEIISEDPSGWWEAELKGKRGLVPAVYLSQI